MTTTKNCVITTDNSTATEQIAEKIGRRLKGGEVLELVSDLGGGKTTFTRGLVRGTSSNNNVASPTFTISKVYNAPEFDVHHFDFYRLADAGLAAHELHDLVDDPKVVIVVEWGGVVQDVLPSERLTVELRRGSDDNRELTFTYPDSLTYLIEDIC